MKAYQGLIFCMLFCLAFPAGAAGALATGISPVAATTETPPYDVSVYIRDAQDAVAGRNWTSALLLTTRGLAWYPHNADLLCMQGYAYRKMGQYQKSIDTVSEGIRLDPKPVRYANRGYGYLAFRNYTAALGDAESGIAMDTTYATSYGVKALALQGMGRNMEALAALNPALALDPENAHYWHIKGIVLSSLGNCTGAREALERSLALDPDYNLPYPGFAGARETLAALDATCIPATQSPAPTRASPGAIAVLGISAALLVFGKRK